MKSGITADMKLKTIEIYTEPISEKNICTRKTLTFKQTFDELVDYLEKVHMNPGLELNADHTNDPIPGDWEIFYQVDIEYGNYRYSGVYLDIFIETEGHPFLLFASAYDPEVSTSAYLKMSRIAAECYLMLSGEGEIVELGDDILTRFGMRIRVGQNIAKFREMNGITQKQLADELDVAKSTIGMWENGKREPNLTMLWKIADYFDTSIDCLLGRSSEHKSG